MGDANGLDRPVSTGQASTTQRADGERKGPRIRLRVGGTPTRRSESMDQIDSVCAEVEPDPGQPMPSAHSDGASMVIRALEQQNRVLQAYVEYLARLCRLPQVSRPVGGRPTAERYLLD